MVHDPGEDLSSLTPDAWVQRWEKAKGAERS
jgi:hypothetical protein